MATFPIGKLNPQTSTTGGVTTAVAKLNFPGFQEILDFTSAGSESSVSVTVDGDTDKEYIVLGDNLSTSVHFRIALNNDTTASHYGYQELTNSAGTISAGRGTDYVPVFLAKALTLFSVLCPTGFIKTMFNQRGRWSSGTTIDYYGCQGWSFNSTSNITSINFYPDSGNFTAGTRIVVYARRSNT